MGESARDGAQLFPNAFPFWELYSCWSYKCLEPWLKRQKIPNWAPKTPLKRS